MRSALNHDKELIFHDIIHYYNLVLSKQDAYEIKQVMSALKSVLDNISNLRQIFGNVHEEDIIYFNAYKDKLFIGREQLGEICNQLLLKFPKIRYYTLAQLKYMRITWELIQETVILPYYFNSKSIRSTIKCISSSGIADVITDCDSGLLREYKLFMNYLIADTEEYISKIFTLDVNHPQLVVGKDTNCDLNINDMDLDDIQFKFQMSNIYDNPGLLLTCMSKKYLTLHKIKGGKYNERELLVLGKDDYIILNNSQGFVIKEIICPLNVRNIKTLIRDNSSPLVFPRANLLNEQNTIWREGVKPKIVLRFTLGEHKREIYRLEEGEVLTLGREPENSIKFIDTSISNFHCKIYYCARYELWVLEENCDETTNGSFLALNIFQRKNNDLPSPPFLIPLGQKTEIRAGTSIFNLKLTEVVTQY